MNQAVMDKTLIEEVEESVGLDAGWKKWEKKGVYNRQTVKGRMDLCPKAASKMLDLSLKCWPLIIVSSQGNGCNL